MVKFKFCALRIIPLDQKDLMFLNMSYFFVKTDSEIILYRDRLNCKKLIGFATRFLMSIFEATSR